MGKGRKQVICLLVVMSVLLWGCASNRDYLTIEEIEVPTANKDIEIAAAKESKTLHADHYQMDLELNETTHQLKGKVVVKLTNQTNDTLSEVYIRNYPASILKDEGKTELSNFHLSHNTIALISTQKEDASIVVVHLGNESISPNEQVTLSFDFVTDIPKKQDRFGYFKRKGMTAYQLSFCFPSIAVYEDGVWNESPYVALGESNYQNITDYDVTIKVPKGYEVVSVGEEQNDGDIFTIKAKQVRELAMVISDSLLVNSEKVDGVTLNHYAFDMEGTKEYNELSRLAMRDSMQLFTKYFGEYPYSELDVVQTFYSTGMEYSGFTMIGLPDVSDFSKIDELYDRAQVAATIAHEIAHQWFYGIVGTNPYQEPWLDEAFAEYCETVLYQHSQMESIAFVNAHSSVDSLWGKESMEEFHEWMDAVKDQGECSKPYAKGINQSYDQYTSDDYSIYVYGEGCRFLYELSRVMNEEVFYDMLAQYIETYYFKTATTQDFIEIVKLYDNREEVNQIIKQYIK